MQFSVHAVQCKGMLHTVLLISLFVHTVTERISSQCTLPSNMMRTGPMSWQETFPMWPMLPVRAFPSTPLILDAVEDMLRLQWTPTMGLDMDCNMLMWILKSHVVRQVIYLRETERNSLAYGHSGWAQQLSTWKYQLLYDHWSQATMSLVTTWMEDCSSAAWVLLLALKFG